MISSPCDETIFRREDETSSQLQRDGSHSIKHAERLKFYIAGCGVVGDGPPVGGGYDNNDSRRDVV
jgi:hypothetical protein